MNTVIKGVGKKIIISNKLINVSKAIGKDVEIPISDITNISFEKASMSRNGNINIEWGNNKENIMYRCFSNDIVEKAVNSISVYLDNRDNELIIETGEKIGILKQTNIENNKRLESKKIDKQNLKDLKDRKIPYCPKCHSTSLTTSDKRLSVGRAVVGGALLGGTGAVLGGLTSKKVNIICMNCGYKFKPGKK